MPTDNGTSSIESLYLAHNSWLRGWLYRRLSNATDAADLAQDTFVRLMQRRLGAPIEEPRAYLRTVARGLVIDLWRHRDIERAWLETLEHLPQEYELSPETSALAMESLIAIDRLLDELRPEVRLAFLLAQLEGLKCPAIAVRLGVSVSTVERYIAKALRHCYGATFECPR